MFLFSRSFVCAPRVGRGDIVKEERNEPGPEEQLVKDKEASELLVCLDSCSCSLTVFDPHPGHNERKEYEIQIVTVAHNS